MAGEAFRTEFAKANPNHPELALMDAHLASLMTEQPALVRNFTVGAVKDIEKNHGVVLNPLEASLALLVAANRPFWFIANRDKPGFMNLVSRPTQIAIFPDPKQFYVPESNDKNLEIQRHFLKVDEAEVIRKKWGIGGLEAVIGDVATHAGLVFAYFDKTGRKVRLHGRNYGYRYARTETPTVGSCVAVVGGFDGTDGLDVDDWYRDRGLGFVWAVRLGVPTQE